MAERRNADLFEVLIGQVTQDREIDMVLGKALCVLGHAEVVEPIRNLLHAGPPRGLSNRRVYAKIPSMVDDRTERRYSPLTAGGNAISCGHLRSDVVSTHGVVR